MLVNLQWVCGCLFGLGCGMVIFALGTGAMAIQPPPPVDGALLFVSGCAALYAVLYIYAAFMLQAFQRRTLVIVAICLSPLAVFTILGAPVALFLLVMGSRVLNDPHIRRAFADVQRGVPLRDVRRTLREASQRPYGDERDDYDDEMKNHRH